MNKREKVMYENFKRQHGKAFADWLYETGKLEPMFNSLYGWSHTRVLLDFALGKIPQIEPELTKEERRSIY